jgi:hypothetical protein
LFLGAYERDNFGDLLLLLATERYLPSEAVERAAAAPFAADMTGSLGRHVPAYAPILAAEPMDVVWTVGGGVGSVYLDLAYRLSATSAGRKAFLETPEADRPGYLGEAMGGTVVEWPYVPALSAFPLQEGAISILNSAGLAGLAGLRPQSRAAALAALRELTALSVRDQRSLAVARRFGLEPSLAPDIVHTLALSRPVDRFAPGPVVVQASAAALGGSGLADLAASLAESSVVRARGVSVLLAGVAYRHDSPALAGQLAADLSARLDAPVPIIGTRRPLELAAAIGQASAFVGSSLHGRVVSAAYDVPRVAFRSGKLNPYAVTWDDAMPYDVVLGEVGPAVDEAVAREADNLGVGRRLAQLAERNIVDIIEIVGKTSRRKAAKQRKRAVRLATSAE